MRHKKNDPPTAERHPDTCRNSISFGDIYICRLACLPCAALETCALDEINDMADSTDRIMRRKGSSKKKEDKA